MSDSVPDQRFIHCFVLMPIDIPGGGNGRPIDFWMPVEQVIGKPPRRLVEFSAGFAPRYRKKFSVASRALTDTRSVARCSSELALCSRAVESIMWSAQTSALYSDGWRKQPSSFVKFFSRKP